MNLDCKIINRCHGFEAKRKNIMNSHGFVNENELVFTRFSTDSPKVLQFENKAFSETGQNVIRLPGNVPRRFSWRSCGLTVSVCKYLPNIPGRETESDAFQEALISSCKKVNRCHGF